MTFGGFFQCKTGRGAKSGLYSIDMQKKFNILVLLALLSASQAALAVKEVIFRQQTQVYSKRNENSEVLGVYDRGDTVPISSKVYGAWRKVIVDVQGKKTVAWVLTKDIRGARIKDSKARQMEEDEKDGQISYRRRTGVGIMGNLSYVYQTKGSVNVQTSIPGITPEVSYSSLSGANVFVGLFGDFNISDTMAIRGYFAMRNMKRSGSASTQGASGNFTITQDMMALGSTLKLYSSKNAIFWWGPGLEIAKTTKFEVKGSTPIDTSFEGTVTEDPLYALATLSAGYDLNLSGRFFILPEIKVGIVPNGDPILMTFEVLIPIAFTF